MNPNPLFGFFRNIYQRAISSGIDLHKMTQKPFTLPVVVLACFIFIATLGWLVFSSVSRDGSAARPMPQTPSSSLEIAAHRSSVSAATTDLSATHATGRHEEIPACSAGDHSHSHLIAAPATHAAVPSKRAWDYHLLESLAAATVGNPIRFDLTDGISATGTIQHLEYVGGTVIMVSGKLDAPESGRFFFQKQTLLGKQGDFAGLVEFPASKSAWRIEPSGPGGASELVKRQLDEVLCILPPPSAEALAADVQEAPPLNPSGVPDYVPPYNEGIISLQSMPGAPGVLYMDYRGGYTPTWGGITYEKPNVTNADIKYVWKRVAEDFMPFNINVTTDIRVYQAAAENSRQRCIMTPTNTAAPGAGGVSYVGVWNNTGDTPNWSFYTSGDYAAEVVSHEVGHALGLNHDGRITPSEGYYDGQGSGSVSWGPIMGSGGRAVRQWSKGEYASANNLQDDLSIIVTNNNSVDYRPDDTGAALATSRYLEVNADRTVFGEGVIETTGDTDAFRFTTTGGAVVLNANPVGNWANLAIKAELANSSDTVIATDNVQTQLSASISTTLAAGTYTFRVTGVGRNDPLVDGFSNYASLGYYSLSGSVTNGVPTTRFSIAENSANGTAVGTVTATSPSPTGYSIASGNTNGAFAISSSGALTVANVAALNYEALAANTQLTVQYELFVNITYANTALNETNRRVVVQVQDVNEAPGITGGAVTILEHSSIGTNVLMVTSTDPDQYDFATFSITAGNTGNVFAINSATGQITVAADIDVASNTVYNLTVAVADQGTPALTASVVVPVTVVNITAGYTPGRIVRTYFESISGSTVSNLTGDAKFPNTPDSEQFLTSFDGQTHGDNFGSTIRGYLIPPATGTYQFWIASDDASELRLSTDANPANAIAIASVSGSTSQYAWTTNVSQQSVTKTLTAGQPYYIEARHKEGTGGDHVAVAWTTPSSAIKQIIPGLYLVPYYQNYAPKPVAATYTIRENAVPGQAIGIVTSADVNVQDTVSGYIITGGNTGGVFAINAATGQLTVALPGLLNATTTPSYTLTIQSTDNGTPVLSGSGTVTVNVVPATGINQTSIAQEIWSGITGSALTDLTTNTNYPYKSTLRRALTSFDSGTNYSDNYGSRIRVKFIPPTTDSYKFYITSDDASSLLFSTNANGSGAAQIASVSGWFAYNNWTGNASQTSAVKALTAGQAVYLEALHKEGGGGDHVQVAYTNSTVTSPTVIPGSMLVPFDINAVPVFSPTSYTYNVTAATATVGMVLGTVTATEPNGETLIYAILSGDSQGAFAINSTTGQITVVNPNRLSNGTVTLQVAAQDGGLGGVYPLGTATASVVINVTSTNTAPAWVSNPIVKPGVVEGVAYSQTLVGSASDVNGGTLTFSKVSGPAWLAVASNGALTGTAGVGTGGLNSFVVRVTDSLGIFADTTLNITVTGINHPPVFTSNPITVAAAHNVPVTGSITATDPDAGDVLTYSKLSGPAWLSVAANGTLSGTPGIADVGDNVFTVRVTDAGGLSADATLNVTVAAPPAYYASMDTNPGWTLDAGWAYGVPTGANQDGYGNPDPTSGQNGTNVIGYNLAGDYEASINPTRWAKTPAIDCTKYTGCKLSFYRWLGVETSTYDHAYIEVSNNGTIWTQVWANSAADTVDAGWIYCEYNISAVADGKSTVYVRWGMGNTDGSWNYCGWNLDEIKVNGTYAGPLVLTAPNGGECWASGSTKNITWTSELGGNVKIELLKNNVLLSTIVDSTLNDGSYSWGISSGLTSGADYRVRITSVESPTKSYTSLGNFSIYMPVITGVSATASSQYDAAHAATYLVNNSGISTAYDITAVHTYDGSAVGQWHDTGASDTTNTITFNLGGSYVMDAIHIWNGNQWAVGSDLTSRGVKQFDVLVSSNGTSFTEVISNATLTKSPGNQTISAQSFSLAGNSGITHVRIHIDSNWGDVGPYRGLSEVMFTGIGQNAGYTITYNANNATSGSVPANQTKTRDVALVLATNSGNLARTGYTFAGWNTAPNGSDANYAVGATYTTNANLTLYAKWLLPYNAWSNGTFSKSFTDTAFTSNPDGDNLVNLLEFAFGMDPTNPATGSLIYAINGDVTRTGTPIIEYFAASGQPQKFHAVFARRKNYSDAGLAYTVEFSADMILWTASAVSPSLRAGAASSGDVDVVEVPFLDSVPLNASGTAAPKFFRVKVMSN